MREFIPQEKKLLKSLIHYKKQNQVNELKFKNLISQIIPHYCIKWDCDKPDSSENITIYSDCQSNEIESRYFEFVDFIYLLEELEKHSFIKRIESSNSGKISHYYYDDYFFEKATKENVYIHTNIKTRDQKTYIEEDNRFVYCCYRLKILDIIKKYYSSIIYPLPTLEELVKNDFKTFEQIKFEKERRISICGIIVAFIIGIISPILTAYCTTGTTRQFEVKDTPKNVKTDTCIIPLQQIENIDISTLQQ